MIFSKMILAVASLIFVFASNANAEVKRDDCDENCQKWQSGIGAKPGPATKCLVEISAPTFGGKVALDVRDESGKSRWGGPRIKTVGNSIVKYKIGCNWLDQSTAEVYLCVEGENGQFSSIRWRKKGALDDVLNSKKLEMCLLGQDCPQFEAKVSP